MKDAIIVLGRGIAKDGTLPPDPISRVKKAVELYNEGVAPRIIMSGGYSYHLVDTPDISEAKAMKDLAVSLGIPSEAIIEEDESLHTIGNAYFTKKVICEPNGWRNLTLIASDEHAPRVTYVFGMMFGPEYEIDIEMSDRVLNDDEYAKEVEHEAASLKMTKEYLASVDAGDDQRIRRIALELNPNDTMQEYYAS